MLVQGKALGSVALNYTTLLNRTMIEAFAARAIVRDEGTQHAPMTTPRGLQRSNHTMTSKTRPAASATDPTAGPPGPSPGYIDGVYAESGVARRRRGLSRW